MQAFNPNTWEVETGGSPSLRPGRSRVSELQDSKDYTQKETLPLPPKKTMKTKQKDKGEIRRIK